MAEDRPAAAHTRDGEGQVPQLANEAERVVEPDATSSIVSSNPEIFAHVLAAVARCRIKKSPNGEFVVRSLDLIEEYVKVSGLKPSALVVLACNFFASACAPMSAAKAADMLLNRLYGPIAQRLEVDVRRRAEALAESLGITPDELLDEARQIAKAPN